MDDKTMFKEWDQFAKSIGGNIQSSKTSHVNHHKQFQIITDDSEIELSWDSQPQKGRGPIVRHESRFRFKLKQNNLTNFSIRPKDFLSSLFSLQKRKFGIKTLDTAYIFKSDNDQLIYELTDMTKEFYAFNKYKSFLIETEIITGTATLTIFIPELITTFDKLTIYNNFGRKLSNKLSGI